MTSRVVAAPAAKKWGDMERRETGEKFLEPRPFKTRGTPFSTMGNALLNAGNVLSQKALLTLGNFLSSIACQNQRSNEVVQISEVMTV